MQLNTISILIHRVVTRAIKGSKDCGHCTYLKKILHLNPQGCSMGNNIYERSMDIYIPTCNKSCMSIHGGYSTCNKIYLRSMDVLHICNKSYISVHRAIICAIKCMQFCMGISHTCIKSCISIHRAVTHAIKCIKYL